MLYLLLMIEVICCVLLCWLWLLVLLCLYGCGCVVGGRGGYGGGGGVRGERWFPGACFGDNMQLFLYFCILVLPFNM